MNLHVQNATGCSPASSELGDEEAAPVGSGEEADTASRSWKLLHNLRIPGTGTPAAKKRGKGGKEAEEQLRRELSQLLSPPAGGVPGAGSLGTDASGRPISVCDTLASATPLPRCQGVACLDVCDLLDDLFALHVTDLEVST